MLKAHRKFREPTMRRTSRVFLPWLNSGKIDTLTVFLHRCRDITQYYINFFWQRGDFSSILADTTTIHRATERFGITSRLAQALAKQAKETVRSAEGKSRPNLHNPTITLDSRFVTVEKFTGSFDYAVKLTGSGAPKIVIPLKSTEHINRKLADSWQIGNTVRMGIRKGRIFVDLILEKPRPKLKKSGEVVGIDSNYKAGVTTSRGEFIGGQAYTKIQSFAKRQKHTYAEAKNVVFNALRSLNFKGVKTLVIENLKRVRYGTRGKFPRVLNRRLSHWLYGAIAAWLERRCEEMGIQLVRKDPWKTSQRCSKCGKWDRRSRKGDLFRCVHCGFTDHADLNAPKNLVFLELAGAYSLRSLPN